ncbi:MAG TPA: hypothetical protein VN328_06375 [Thermodesulfovibrionales bacterium]|nr:hypothetical protein [Thermodesulfovibrionales bacterium]
MYANLNAIGLLLVIGFTSALLLKFGRRPRNFSTIVFAILGYVLFSVLVAPQVMTMGMDGQPTFQLFIPGLCLFLILLFIDKIIIKLAMVVLLYFTVMGLGRQYVHLINTEQYAGRSDLSEYVQKVYKGAITSLLLSEARTDTKSYPQGWLRDSLAETRSEALRKIIDNLKKRPRHKIRISHL